MLYALLQIFIRLYFSLLFRAEITGQENVPADGGVIVAANHLSNWDPPLLATFLQRHVNYMAKEELFENPIFSAAIRSCHAFPVKRGEADRGAIKTAVGVLKAGHCLGLFPEGTRSKDGQMGKAEAGGALIAAMTGAPVIPAAIIGTGDIFSGGNPFPRLKVSYGSPLVFKGNRKNKAELEEFSQRIMAAIAALKDSADNVESKL